MPEGVNEKANNISNPIGDEVMVEVAMPKSFKIKMVEASKLTEFKVWGLISSILSNIFVGFLVTAITNTIREKQLLLWGITGVFALMTIGAIGMTIWANSKMESQETKINLKATR